jgi:hypothetical protein
MLNMAACPWPHYSDKIRRGIAASLRYAEAQGAMRASRTLPVAIYPGRKLRGENQARVAVDFARETEVAAEPFQHGESVRYLCIR